LPHRPPEHWLWGETGHMGERADPRPLLEGVLPRLADRPVVGSGLPARPILDGWVRERVAEGRSPARGVLDRLSHQPTVVAERADDLAPAAPGGVWPTGPQARGGARVHWPQRAGAGRDRSRVPPGVFHRRPDLARHWECSLRGQRA